ncbi:GntR family transcriptional regulator [Nesterenkonia halotolerans]|uniref:DNA-binding GntR family transcriptional regulator n=1 Tax=Nesterenkonia halotolerans TaxID=225325 RepID=A0ABR9J9F6_9MICC|nr:GntR family transcriptional regulator [Nesterenkonia halotolerans]MBE1515530.1 DNA-binding GntR family transcriptional regulator [Nesterenkonia halotolerans]
MTDVMWHSLSAEGLSEHAHAPERVAELLRGAISAGAIRPGTKLPEVQLTHQLEISRHTLRSGFQILAAEGLVEKHPNRGVFVHQPTAEDIEEIYRVRRVLEVGAVRTADFPPEELEQLHLIVSGAELARELGDVPAMAQANQVFHRTIAAQVRSPMIDALMEQVLARMRLAFHAKSEQPSFHHTYIRRNGELATLLSSGDRQAAEDYLVEYLGAAEAELLEHLDS